MGDRPSGSSAFRKIIVVYGYECEAARTFSTFRSTLHVSAISAELADPVRTSHVEKIYSEQKWTSGEEVELFEANPTLAYVRFPDGKESSVSIMDFSLCPSSDTSSYLTVEVPADIVPDPGKEQVLTATPVEKEPGYAPSGVDHESAGDNPMPPTRSTPGRLR